MKTWLMGVAILLAAFSATAQSWVKIHYDTGAGTPTQQVEGLLRAAEGAPNGQALLILHHGGGFSFNTTGPYAAFFSRRGFVTLELKMFDVSSDVPAPLVLRGQMMGALKHMAQIPGVRHVSAMGMSLGAFLAMDASSSWFYDHYQAGALRFHKLAALYPVCWFYDEALRGNAGDIRPFQGMPADHFQRFASVPLLILAAGKDSYDGLDADACPQMVRQLPDPRQREITQVQVFPNASHGWDHGRDYSFPVRGGCKGRTNCTNRITYSPEVTERGKQAMLSFFNQP